MQWFPIKSTHFFWNSQASFREGESFQKITIIFLCRRFAIFLFIFIMNDRGRNVHFHNFLRAMFLPTQCCGFGKLNNTLQLIGKLHLCFIWASTKTQWDHSFDTTTRKHNSILKRKITGEMMTIAEYKEAQESHATNPEGSKTSPTTAIARSKKTFFAESFVEREESGIIYKKKEKKKKEKRKKNMQLNQVTGSKGKWKKTRPICHHQHSLDLPTQETLSIWKGERLRHWEDDQGHNLCCWNTSRNPIENNKTNGQLLRKVSKTRGKNVKKAYRNCCKLAIRCELRGKIRRNRRMKI